MKHLKKFNESQSIKFTRGDILDGIGIILSDLGDILSKYEDLGFESEITGTWTYLFQHNWKWWDLDIKNGELINNPVFSNYGLPEIDKIGDDWRIGINFSLGKNWKTPQFINMISELYSHHPFIAISSSRWSMRNSEISSTNSVKNWRRTDGITLGGTRKIGENIEIKWSIGYISQVV